MPHHVWLLSGSTAIESKMSTVPTHLLGMSPLPTYGVILQDEPIVVEEVINPSQVGLRRQSHHL